MNLNNLKLNETQSSKWLDNLIIFLAPVGVIYLVSVIGLIQANDGGVRLDFFAPNGFTLGAMTLYLLNSILDFLRKRLTLKT